MLCPRLSETAKPVGSRDPSVHEKIAARDESPIGSHEECAHRTDLIGSACTTGNRAFNHLPVTFAARPAEFVFGKGGHHDPWTDRVDTRSALPPMEGLGHHAKRVSALGELVGVKRAGHLVELKERKAKKLLPAW